MSKNCTAELPESSDGVCPSFPFKLNLCKRHYIGKLEKELKREQDCVDFYADKEFYEYISSKELIIKDRENSVEKDLGKLARKIQSERTL